MTIKNEPFRWWCYKVLPLVYDDSLSYYELLCKVMDMLNGILGDTQVLTEQVDELGEAFITLKNYVDTYFDDLDLTDEINAKLDEMADSGELAKVMEQVVIRQPHIINSNLYFTTYTTLVNFNGGCYIGDNKIVIYYSSQSSNTGLLRCYNLNTKSLEWEHELECYHGNSVTYNDSDNCIYITGCYSYDNASVLVPYIFKVDMDDPSTIAEVIAPNVSGIYSCAYYDGKYYAITERGTTAGICNRVTIFNEDFEQEGSILLENYLALSNISTQGVQCVCNDVIYALGYTNRVIQAFTLEGHLINSYQIPDYINGYRYAGECECIIYDFDHDSFYLGSQTIGCGESAIRIGNIIELGIYKTINSENVLLDLTAPDSGILEDSFSTTTALYVDCSRTPHPFSALNPYFNTLRDAVDFLKNNKSAGCIVLTRIGESFNGINIILNNFKGTIRKSPTGTSPLFNAVTLFDSEVTFDGCTFRADNYRTYTLDGQDHDNCIIAKNSTVNMTKDDIFNTGSTVLLLNSELAGSFAGTVIVGDYSRYNFYPQDNPKIIVDSNKYESGNHVYAIPYSVYEANDTIVPSFEFTENADYTTLIDKPCIAKLDYNAAYVSAVTGSIITLKRYDSAKYVDINMGTKKIDAISTGQNARIKWLI